LFYGGFADVLRPVQGVREIRDPVFAPVFNALKGYAEAVFIARVGDRRTDLSDYIYRLGKTHQPVRIGLKKEEFYQKGAPDRDIMLGQDSHPASAQVQGSRFHFFAAEHPADILRAVDLVGYAKIDA
jgi:hypothetical protein